MAGDSKELVSSGSALPWWAVKKRSALFLLVLAACASPEQQAITTEAQATVTTVAPSTSSSSSPTTTSIGQSTTAPAPVAPLAGLVYTEITSGLPFPVMLVPRPGDGVLFLATKDGHVWSLETGTPVRVMDISDHVRNSGEQGLLGMAFHPEDPARLFLHYSDPNGDTVVSEFNKFDAASERLIFQLEQLAANHNGGTIAFGPEGLLWLGLGDGGGSGDTFGTGQTTDDLLAGILRFDADRQGEVVPEVWAIGLRNPWRFSFDGDLVYIGDVGQYAYEEINVAPVESASLNYGWPVTEGLHCFEPREGCRTDGFTRPVLEVSHADTGTCSITGGAVYRGSAIPELVGHYFYSDYCAGWLRSFLYQDGRATEPRDWTEQVGVPGNVISFSTDAAGEIYLMTDTTLFRIDPVR